MVIAFDFLTQGLQQPGDGNQHGDSPSLDGVDDFRRAQGVQENNRAAEQLRDKNSEELAENVAQGEQVEKPDGMEDAFVLEILVYLRLERLDVGENVAMGNGDALGFGRSAGCEDNLHQVVAHQVRVATGLRRMTRNGLPQTLQAEGRQTVI